MVLIWKDITEFSVGQEIRTISGMVYIILEFVSSVSHKLKKSGKARKIEKNIEIDHVLIKNVKTGTTCKVTPYKNFCFKLNADS